MSVEITLCSQMPVPVPVEQLAITVHFSIEKNNYRKTAEWLTKHRTPNGIIHFAPETSPGPAARSGLPAPELHETFERSPSDNSLSATGIICKNVHVLLRRQESSPSPETASGVVLEDGAHVLQCRGVTLEPGANRITFRTQVRVEGEAGPDSKGGREGRRARQHGRKRGASARQPGLHVCVSSKKSRLVCFNRFVAVDTSFKNVCLF